MQKENDNKIDNEKNKFLQNMVEIAGKLQRASSLSVLLSLNIESSEMDKKELENLSNTVTDYIIDIREKFQKLEDDILTIK